MPRSKKTKTTISSADLMNIVVDNITDNDIDLLYDGDGYITIVDKQGRSKIEIKFTIGLE